MDIICYDFDNTVYRGDSSTHFTFWCLGHFPRTWLHLPAIVFWGALFGLRICTKTRFKSHLFGYLRYVKDVDKAVADFWKGHRKNLVSPKGPQPGCDHLSIAGIPPGAGV